ncbi:anthranilate synthase component II [Enterococcus sp. HY326]|uniref:anthranilate synthase component II n=1 Tax=Enterococcus sp. HY326 TaxID=2971265 RepID=UPI00223FAF35|nr:aminodeoxychorismate/anthranilate synthase component II [Enterococcus sp. HY326]
MILIVDNYDSFTYNLVHQVSGEVVVLRNDHPQLLETAAKADGIILSPGPGRPEEAGLMPTLLQKFYQDKPILGICLGHQAIVQLFGGQVVGAPQIRHGKISQLIFEKTGLFNELSEASVMRYHSLIAEESSSPSQLKITARATDDQTIMALEHQSLPIYGLQFHPESIGTASGQEMIDQFLKRTEMEALDYANNF